MARTAGTSGVVAGACLYGTVAHASELEITVANVRNDRGHIQVNVCSEQTFLTDQCPYHAAAPSVLGQTVVRVTVPAGVWAVQVYHDENDNETVDRDALGIPKEGIGFSNNARFRFAPPRFVDARFQLAEPGGRISLSLRYFVN